MAQNCWQMSAKNIFQEKLSPESPFKSRSLLSSVCNCTVTVSTGLYGRVREMSGYFHTDLFVKSTDMRQFLLSTSCVHVFILFSIRNIHWNRCFWINGLQKRWKWEPSRFRLARCSPSVTSWQIHIVFRTSGPAKSYAIAETPSWKILVCAEFLRNYITENMNSTSDPL